MIGPGSNPNVLITTYWKPEAKARLLSGTHLHILTEVNPFRTKELAKIYIFFYLSAKLKYQVSLI